MTLSRFLTLKLRVIANNSEHLFIENQLLVVYLRTVKLDQTYWTSFAGFRFDLTTSYFNRKLKI